MSAMQQGPEISALFVDIGGVLLTNGWDHNSRQKGAEKFDLNYHDMNERHHLTFDTYEEGKLSLDEYLNRVIFYKERSFSRRTFKDFMFAQSQPYPEMLNLLRDLKRQYRLRIAAVSNEGRELTVYRIRKFELGQIIDFFISSCFVHFRKPDRDIYQMALDVSQISAEKVIYLEDREMFVDEARSLGINGVVHTDYKSTKQALEAYGLVLKSE
jgi:putative hydrolase of the HAD superfamily